MAVYISITIIVLTLALLWTMLRKQDFNYDVGYDVIIVGAGSAGSVLANRLTENSTIKVALVEAGDVPSGFIGWLSSVPIATPLLQRTSIDWSYISTPQTYGCRSLRNKQFIIPAGKAVGGTSLINAMVYVRGNKLDYDGWEQEFGASGWNYDNMLHYFIKSESNKRHDLLNSGYHGNDGPMIVTDVDTLDELTTAFLSAGRQAGYSEIDVNGPTQIGFMKAQATTYQGRRYSTYDAYVKSVISRDNLHLFNNHHVTKLILDHQSETGEIKTQGVELKNGKKLHVRPGGEVILSAGTVGSAKLMMMSGLGPQKHLKSVGISPLVDLPVGENLQDHPMAAIYFSIEKPLSITESKMKSINSIFKYLFWGEGYLSGASALNGISFIKTKYQSVNSTIPDIQLMSIGVGSVGNSTMKSLSNYNEDAWEKFLPPNHSTNQEGFLIAVTLVNNLTSRGTIRLSSSDSSDDVLIDPNLFSSEEDVKRLVEGIKMTIDIITSSEAFKELGAKPYLPVYKGCEKLQVPSDEYFECLVKNVATTVYHSSGTCRMGAANRSDTVVDPQLRVKGVDGLRVVDASVMPIIPTGNTNAPVIAIAERASDLIKNHIKYG